MHREIQIKQFPIVTTHWWPKTRNERFVWENEQYLYRFLPLVHNHVQVIWVRTRIRCVRALWQWVTYTHERSLPALAKTNCAFTPQAARSSKWLEVIHFKCEPAASSCESVAARFGRWGRRGVLKSSQLYGNELWRGSAATSQNVEVLRLRGFQRTRSCKLWFRPH